MLKTLKKAKSLADLAALLGYKPSTLAFVLYKIPPQLRYTTFSIPKKGGGERQIDAPDPRLKRLQRCLSDLLYECQQEIESADPSRRSLSHAFRKSHSIISNASNHRNRRYVLNLDLADFFPSLNFGRVRGFFLKNNDFALHKDVATIIAQIGCFGHALPQGSPCSPIISELVTHFLDVRLAQLAKLHKCTYSRYADDITFSTNQVAFPSALARKSKGKWTLGKTLKSKISDAGFSINASKTRMQYRGSRQTVTGLTVNAKVNIQADYYRSTRAMLHSLFTTGQFHRGDDVPLATTSYLEGRLAHIYYVKEQHPARVAAQNGNAPKTNAPKTKAKNRQPSALRELYHRLLFFKHFVANELPTVVCEGKTDNIYLKHAIRSLTKPGELPIRLFSYSRHSQDILQLRGGTGDIVNFLAAYPSFLEEYQGTPLKHPVIFLIDNDDGAKGVFGVLKSKFYVTANHLTDLPFYRLWQNLFLVKTPIIGPTGHSFIENFFDPSLLTTFVGGKTFNPQKDHDAPNEYGKVVFAEQVIAKNAAKIDFSGFAPLIERLAAVIAEYKK